MTYLLRPSARPITLGFATADAALTANAARGSAVALRQTSAPMVSAISGLRIIGYRPIRLVIKLDSLTE